MLRPYATGCVGEKFLKAEIKKTGMMTECFYCRNVHRCLTLHQIADHFERAFQQHFSRTLTEPSSSGIRDAVPIGIDQANPPLT